jgi:hypothetical protein
MRHGDGHGVALSNYPPLRLISSKLKAKEEEPSATWAPAAAAPPPVTNPTGGARFITAHAPAPQV